VMEVNRGQLRGTCIDHSISNPCGPSINVDLLLENETSSEFKYRLLQTTFANPAIKNSETHIRAHTHTHT